MLIYRHIQAGTLTRWSVGLPAALIGALLLVGPQRPLVSVVVLAVLGLCLLLFHSLTTSVGTEAVTLAFGPGWIRRSVPLADIAAVRTVRNPWWYGWGIRLTPHGWLYNVSGLSAVELDLAGGGRLRIGTDEPERLAAAIEQAARFAR